MNAPGRRVACGVVGLLCVLALRPARCSAQATKAYNFAANPSDLQSVGGFLGVCGLPESQLSPKSVETMKNAPATDTMKIIKKAMADKLTDEALCVGYITGLYEGWNEGNDHGVMVAHTQAAVPLNLTPVLKSMSLKEIEAIEAESRTDVACVPNHATFGDLKNTVTAYLRSQVRSNPLLRLALTSRLFPYALLHAFPCPATPPEPKSNRAKR